MCYTTPQRPLRQWCLKEKVTGMDMPCIDFFATSSFGVCAFCNSTLAPLNHIRGATCYDDTVATTHTCLLTRVKIFVHVILA